MIEEPLSFVQLLNIMYTIFNNCSMTAHLIWVGIPVLYPTRANGIVELLNFSLFDNTYGAY